MDEIIDAMLADGWIHSTGADFLRALAHPLIAAPGAPLADRFAAAYAATRAWAPAPRATPPPSPPLRLALSHTCAALGCAASDCHLCRNDPDRRCARHLRPKYLVDDVLAARCKAALHVDVLPAANSAGGCDAATALDRLPAFKLQVCALEASRCMAAVWADLPSHAQLCVSGGRGEGGIGAPEPVLRCAGGGTLLDAGPSRFMVEFAGPGARVPLPELSFKRSGESMLGRKQPEIALAVRAVRADDGTPLDALIEPVFSEPFQLATKRVKGNLKADVPHMDDEVKVIQHIGSATVTKLQDICASVRASSSRELDAPLPQGRARITTVAQLRELIQALAHNVPAEKQVIEALSMNMEKWREVTEHVARAVQPDSLARAFYLRPAEPADGDALGLVFPCSRGRITLEADRVCGLLQRRGVEERFTPWDAVLMAHDLRTLADRNALFAAAAAAWQAPGHPGWGYWKLHGVVVDSDADAATLRDAAAYPAAECDIPVYDSAAGRAAAAPATAAPAPAPLPEDMWLCSPFEGTDLVHAQHALLGGAGPPPPPSTIPFAAARDAGLTTTSAPGGVPFGSASLFAGIAASDRGDPQPAGGRGGGGDALGISSLVPSTFSPSFGHGWAQSGAQTRAGGAAGAAAAGAATAAGTPADDADAGCSLVRDRSVGQTSAHLMSGALYAKRHNFFASDDLNLGWLGSANGSSLIGRPHARDDLSAEAVHMHGSAVCFQSLSLEPDGVAGAADAGCAALPSASADMRR